MTNEKKISADCKDMWNAFMVEGAKFSESGILFCPTTAKEIPRELFHTPKREQLIIGG